MKSKWRFISSVVQLIIGVLAIITFAAVLLSGEVESIIDYIGALLLSVGFVVLRVIGIPECQSQK